MRGTTRPCSAPERRKTDTISDAGEGLNEQKFDKQTVRVICANCGHQRRNHRVLHEKVDRYCDDPHGPEIRREYHRFVECMGCNTPKYVISTLDLQNYDEYEGGPNETNYIVHPDAPGSAVRRAAVINNDDSFGSGPRLEDVSGDHRGAECQHPHSGRRRAARCRRGHLPG